MHCFPVIAVRIFNYLPVEVRLLEAAQFERFVKEWCSTLSRSFLIALSSTSKIVFLKECLYS